MSGRSSISASPLPPRLVAITPGAFGAHVDSQTSPSQLAMKFGALARAGGGDGGRIGVLLRDPALDLVGWSAWLERAVPLIRAAGLVLGVNPGPRHQPDEVAAFCQQVARWRPDFLQLPERAAPPDIWRNAINSMACPNVALSRSAHDEAGVRRAFDAGADWVMVSPVLATPSKPEVAPLGLAGLARLVAAASGPVLALGGINAAQVAGCFDAGAAGVAVMRAAWTDDVSALVVRCMAHPTAP